MIKKGITADISLEKEKLDAPFGVDYFLWLPTKDHTAPSQDQLKAGVKFIDELIKNMIKIYIHCKRGHGRAPTLVAAYFISKGMDVEQAIEEIKNKRPVIHPNKIQRNALDMFQKK